MAPSVARASAMALLLALGACGSRSELDAGALDDEQPQPPVKPDPTTPKPPLPKPEPEPEPKPDPPPTGGHVLVAGCAARCDGGCTFPGVVEGSRSDTGENVIPNSATPNGSGYSCTADLPVGTEVRLEATVAPGFRFVEWFSIGPGDFGWQACPCALSVDPVCGFVVKTTLYCGAAYTTL